MLLSSYTFLLSLYSLTFNSFWDASDIAYLYDENVKESFNSFWDASNRRYKFNILRYRLYFQFLLGCFLYLSISTGDQIWFLSIPSGMLLHVVDQRRAFNIEMLSIPSGMLRRQGPTPPLGGCRHLSIPSGMLQDLIPKVYTSEELNFQFLLGCFSSSINALDLRYYPFNSFWDASKSRRRGRGGGRNELSIPSGMLL